MYTPMEITLLSSTHHAFHHFRTCTDEAVVADDGGAGLYRFQHAAYAHAAGQMHRSLPICAQEPTVAQVSTMLFSST